MKLTSVEIHPNGSSDVVVLSFRDPRAENPYNVKEIIGLDADEIISKYYGASGSSKFYTLSLTKKDIVLRIELKPDFSSSQSYSDLRDSLYKIIQSSRTGKIQLQFKNGATAIAAISGFISKFEASLFDKKPAIQITVKCDDPLLKGLTPIVVDVDTLNPASTVITDTISTAPHGFTFDIRVLAGGIDSLKITDPDDDSWSFESTPIGGFLENDIIHFSSEYNQKEFYITRGSTIIYLADTIGLGPIWPIMFPGENTFSFDDPTLLVWEAISYYTTYWGV